MSDFSPPSTAGSAELRAAALAALKLADPDEKCSAVAALGASLISLDTAIEFLEVGELPGRPARPVLVDPKTVPRRALGTPAGRAALLHALAHIEFNAINLALDILWRYPRLPSDFYRDWARVATEEASHFQLLRAHLRTHGADYGDFDAHNGLWEIAEKTKDDLLARLALVARVLEARGLDVTPGMRDRLAGVGDHDGAAILSIILRDEIGHVRVGSRWFHAICVERGLDPVSAHQQLAARYAAPPLRGPFNLLARREAGFTDDEIDALTQVQATPKG